MSSRPGASRSRRRAWWDKQELAADLRDWPLLKLLFFNFWFRLVAAFFLTGVIAIAVMVPKVWLATPQGFRPEVRIRLMDRVRVWSLKEGARRHERAGRYSDAWMVWRSAWADNLADQETLHGLLNVLMKVETPEKQAGVAVEAGTWLLRLGQTNVVDLGLIALAWLRCGLEPQAAAILDLGRDRLPPEMEQLYLTSLMHAGRGEEFGSRLQTNKVLLASLERGERLTNRMITGASFELYYLTYQAGWGPEDRRSDAMSRLRAGRANRETEKLAYDLEFLVHQHNLDTEKCGLLLEELQALGKADLHHYGVYWELLLADGQKEKARDLALGCSVSPRNILEALQLAQILTRLELWDKASQLLKSYSARAGWVGEMVVLHAQVLIAEQKWEELRQLALQIRLQPEAMELLSGYTQYLEGLADWRLGHRDFAQRAFERLANEGIRDPRLAVKAADVLLGINTPATAEAVLLAHRRELANDPAYLSVLIACADMLKRDSYLWEAVSKLHELRPKDPIAAHNYAVGLLVFRRQPEEAVRCTLEAHQRFPKQPRVTLNHAGALMLNERLEEAETLIRQILPDKLEASDQAQYYLLMFELAYRRHQPEQARALAAQIDRTELFPTQVKWLRQSLQSLEPSATKS